MMMIAIKKINVENVPKVDLNFRDSMDKVIVARNLYYNNGFFLVARKRSKEVDEFDRTHC